MTGAPHTFLMRVASLPIDAALAPCPGEIDELLARRNRARAAAENSCKALCDHAYGLVRHAPPDTAHRLLAVQRAARADRPVDEDAAGALDARGRGLLADWRDARSGLDASERAMAVWCDRVDARHDARLDSILHDENFAISLALANERLGGLFWPASGASRRAMKKRRDLRRLAQNYLRRAATKTSPFAGFTHAGLARIAPGVPRRANVPCAPVHRWFGLDLGMAEHAAATSEDTANIPLRVNATLNMAGDRLLFVVTGSDGRIDETIVTLVDTVMLRLVRDSLSAGPMTVRTLAQALADTLGAADEGAALNDYVASLAEIGLLTPERAPQDPQLALAAFLPEPARAAFDTLPGASPGAAVAALERIDGGARAATGLCAHETTGHPRRAVQLSTAIPEPLELDPARLQPVTDALGAFKPICALFDASEAITRTLTDYAATLPEGRPIGFTAFCHGLFQSAAWRTLQAADPFVTIGNGADDAAGPARTAFAKALRAAVENAGDTAEIELGALVADTARKVPPETGPLARTVGYFGQLGETDEAYTFHLNQVVAGNGCYAAHYADARAFDGVGTALGQAMRHATRAAPGVTPVEIAAGLGTNIQLHDPILPDRIVYPGAIFDPETPGDICWADLEVLPRGPDRRPALRDRASGRLLAPLRHGPLGPHLLPELYRVLAAFGPLSAPDIDFIRLIEPPEGTDRVTCLPRLRLGPVVLHRRCWRVPPACRVRPAAPDRLERFLEIRRWAETLGLPRFVFATPWRVTELVAAGKSVKNFAGTYKPFFVDFDDPHCVETFERYARRSEGTLTLTEMAPAPDALPYRRDGKAHVMELLMEL